MAVSQTDLKEVLIAHQKAMEIYIEVHRQYEEIIEMLNDMKEKDQPHFSLSEKFANTFELRINAIEKTLAHELEIAQRNLIDAINKSSYEVFEKSEESTYKASSDALVKYDDSKIIIMENFNKLEKKVESDIGSIKNDLAEMKKTGIDTQKSVAKNTLIYTGAILVVILTMLFKIAFGV